MSHLWTWLVCNNVCYKKILADTKQWLEIYNELTSGIRPELNNAQSLAHTYVHVQSTLLRHTDLSSLDFIFWADISESLRASRNCSSNFSSISFISSRRHDRSSRNWRFSCCNFITVHELPGINYYGKNVWNIFTFNKICNHFHILIHF